MTLLHIHSKVTRDIPNLMGKGARTVPKYLVLVCAPVIESLTLIER